MNVASISFSPDGFEVFEGGRSLLRRSWGVGNWTLEIVDTRVPFGGQAEGARPRVTELTPEQRDADRAVLGLPPDPSADPILLTNANLDGSVTLNLGLLHRPALDDDTARRLVQATTQRGFEVRRAASPAHRGGIAAVYTRVTTRRSIDTPEVE